MSSLKFISANKFYRVMSLKLKKKMSLGNFFKEYGLLHQSDTYH